MSNAIQESSYTIGTTAVSLGSNGFVGRAGITIFNAGGGGVLYVGSGGVTIGGGISLASNATPLQLPTPEGAAVYGIASLAGTLVRIIEY